jgi:hypothetical protein
MPAPLNTDSEITQALAKAIRGEIEKRIEGAIAEEIETVKKNVERRVRSEVGQIAANVLTNIKFATFGRELHIIVDFQNTK